MQVCKITSIVGARPQFIKAAAVNRALVTFNKRNDNIRLEESMVHTGQHYDESMSKVFFDELQIPKATINLGVGSGSHGYQTGTMLERIESVLLDNRPDWVLVYGDTNSTLAGALSAAKLHIPIAHIEAGLRSFNRQMPEEINRVVVDHLSILLFSPTYTATQNLAKEGITEGVHQVGDVMYDSVLFNARLSEQSSKIMQQLGLTKESFYLATIHRAENTDNPERMNDILSAFSQIDRLIVLPMHPRTRNSLGIEIAKISANVHVIDPVSYLDMLTLEKNAHMILTDSGGVQKEAYWFKVPCITLRDETEWVELVQAGCNQVVGSNISAISMAVAGAEEKADMQLPTQAPELYGDGHSAEKIVAILHNTAKEKRTTD
jgi:UDP-GlcNAc3NAcA epimerase